MLNCYLVTRVHQPKVSVLLTTDKPVKNCKLNHNYYNTYKVIAIVSFQLFIKVFTLICNVN